MGASDARRGVLELPGEFAASRLHSRVDFLRLVLRLRPHVVTDLWERALPEFKLVVLRHFHQEIFADLESDLDCLKSKQEELLDASREHADFLTERLQQRLDPGLSATQPDLVRLAFRFSSSLKGKENRTLRQK